MGTSDNRVTLPVVRIDTSVASALDLLRDFNVSGVLRMAEHDNRILYAGELLKARARNLEKCEFVSGGDTVATLIRKSTRDFRLNDIIRPFILGPYEEQLRDLDLSYGLAGSGGPTVQIISIHPELTTTLRTGRAYSCTGTQHGLATHYFPMPPVVAGHRCPWAPECETSAHPRSTIQLISL